MVLSNVVYCWSCIGERCDGLFDVIGALLLVVDIVMMGHLASHVVYCWTLEHVLEVMASLTLGPFCWWLL